MKPETVLITGVAGFIGRYVSRFFSEQNMNVVGIDYAAPENAPLNNLNSYHRLKLPSLELNQILKNSNPQICVHCAGTASIGLSMTDPHSDFYGNAVLTFEVLNSLRLDSPDCRFVFLSSAAVYGNPPSLPIRETHPTAPISPYGFHKLEGEKICAEFSNVYGLNTAILRIFSAYGPGLRRQVIWDICQKALTQTNVKLQGTGNESRDFIHALDIARAIFEISYSAPLQGEIYNLASGEEITIAELSAMVLETLEYKGPSPQFDGFVSDGTPLNWCADITKLKDMGFNVQVPFKRGIQVFVNWCKAEFLGI